MVKPSYLFKHSNSIALFPNKEQGNNLVEKLTKQQSIPLTASGSQAR
jgi:hypothetical protein